MDQLPCELIHRILRYINEPLDLFRMSCVCSRWQLFIIHDKYFLNQWFSQLLKYTQNFWSCSLDVYGDICKPLWELNMDESLFPIHLRPNNINFLSWLLTIDRSLFPINLRSSRCDFLPWFNLKDSHDYKLLFQLNFCLSFCDSSHSFSFWLFLPHYCELNIQAGSYNVKSSNILLRSDEKYYFNNGKCISIATRWFHIVLNKIDSQSNYRIYIDGEYVTNLEQNQISFDKLAQNLSILNILLYRKSDNDSLELSNQARIADFNGFKRCLTLIEMRAIYQQQTSIKQVKVGTYINHNKT